MKRHLLLATVAMSAVLLPEAASQAQPEEAATRSGLTTEIIVTARRREESMQRVPVAITAFDTEALKAAGIKDVDDLKFHAPSFVSAPGYFGSSVPGFGIRGQRPDEALATQDGAVLVYFDDVPLQRPHGVGQILYDLENVQVLKGPQGTLFGKNTTGGAVLVNPKRPEFDGLKGEINGLVGSYNHYAVDGVVNIPVSDSFAVRVAGRLVRRNGYTDDLADGQELDDDHNESWRVSTLWKPMDSVEITTVYQGFQMDVAGVSWKLVDVKPVNTYGIFLPLVGVPSPTPGWQAELAQINASDFHTVINDQDNQETVDTWNLTNTIDWDLGGATLRNVFGYRKIETFTAFDYDASTQTFILPGDGTVSSLFNSTNLNRGHQYSDEIQLLGTAFDDSLDWIAGAFYFKEKNFDDQHSELLGRRTNTGTGINTSYSIFAQGTYRLPVIDGLSFTGGVRYTWDERELRAESTIQGLFSPALGCRLTDAMGVPLSPCLRVVEKKFRAPSWTVSLDYQATDDVLLYVAHRHGYRSGGWNLRSLTPGDTVPFDPEEVNDVEVGIKSTWNFNGATLRFNGAYYHQWYKDIQRTVTAPIGPGGSLITSVLNAASAQIQGFEAEMAVLPTNDIEFTGFIGWTDAKYDSFVDFDALGNPLDFSDRTFSYVPEVTMGLTARYTLPLDDSIGAVSLSANWYYQTEMQSTTQNDGGDVGLIDGYDLTNFYVDWDDMLGQPIDLRFFVKNAFDEEYYSSGLTLYDALGFSIRNIGAPRTYGFEARYRFE